MNKRRLQQAIFGLSMLLTISLFTACGESGNGSGNENTDKGPQCCADCKPMKSNDIEETAWTSLMLPFGDNDIICVANSKELVILYPGTSGNEAFKKVVDKMDTHMLTFGFAKAGAIQKVVQEPYKEGTDYVSGKSVHLFYHQGPMLYDLNFSFQQGTKDVAEMRMGVVLDAPYRPDMNRLPSIHAINVVRTEGIINAVSDAQIDICQQELIDAIDPKDKFMRIDLPEIKRLAALDPQAPILEDGAAPNPKAMTWQAVMKHNKMLGSRISLLVVDIREEKEASFSGDKLNPGSTKGVVMLHYGKDSKVLCAKEFEANSTEGLSGGDNANAAKDLADNTKRAVAAAIKSMAGEREVSDFGRADQD